MRPLPVFEDSPCCQPCAVGDEGGLGSAVGCVPPWIQHENIPFSVPCQTMSSLNLPSCPGSREEKRPAMRRRQLPERSQQNQVQARDG